ncbi:hypothetical protein GCM10012290_05510 [Halolactibacillus alkaliphilus]|uniref:Uncharacterized protein n=1 Tax=Halolactibacillus alkaliphilus TaxID=442899 RepID=A0A511X4W2_9BACI|nr:type II toxin-antitoxin system RelE/ParE family toxin [Halolactibacillus alkaliphilus]GEN57971.1 hypothetical protein HAL01_24350 [Halolactibacillus alkaliphilus]GGN66157.1 hypothetical protein GCM10012290_05510 [Halolactibacillus alkaliphilus]SFO67230.1 addiction module toxin, RelE/StbE family [Halolactibacillus alkaliphilus]
MYKIKVNPMATEDLIEIRDYIQKELDNPTAAVDVIKKIIAKYEGLKKFPLMGVELSTKINVQTDFRYVVSGNYLVIYRADHEFVYIYRILYAGRDYLRILFPNEVGTNFQEE